MVRIKSLLVALAIFGSASVARADFGMSMFNAANSAAINIAGTTSINSAISNSAKRENRSTSTTRNNTTINRNPNLLLYRPSPQVSAQLKDRFWNTLKQEHPQSAQEIDTTLKHQDIIGAFKSDLAPYGLRAENVGDTLTAYWITMWMIANRAEIPPLEQVQAASKQVNAVILGNNFVTQKDDNQKQIIAETLIYETMLALGMRSKAINSGDLVFMNELADAAYQNLLKQNIDLRALKLTNQGFIYN